MNGIGHRILCAVAVAVLAVVPADLIALRPQEGAKASAQSAALKAKRDAKAPTTLRGVFSNGQAERGKDLYLALCQSCHVAVAHTGPVFRGHWAGRPLSDLYTFVATRMPKNEPASLAPETYADLLAYILKLNQMPAGGADLAPDLPAMQHVRIQFAPPLKRAKQ